MCCLPAGFLTFDAVQLVLLNQGFCDERVCEVLTIDVDPRSISVCRERERAEVRIENRQKIGREMKKGVKE